MPRSVLPRERRLSRAEAELEACLARARSNPAEEPAFFRRLLRATVYTHAPASDDSGKIRLVQFRHPDGFDAIPFFTSLGKAQAAGSAAVRILNLSGRDLLAGTRGAILMLNPNDGGAVLYPEEIAALLDSGVLARVEKNEHDGLQVRPAQAAPAWLVSTLTACLQSAAFVSAAYLLETNPTPAWTQRPGLLICLVAEPVFAERAARLVGCAIQPMCSAHAPIIDVVIHDIHAPMPAYLVQTDVVPFFNRAPAA